MGFDRGKWGAGILLIMLGIVFLLDNFGVPAVDLKWLFDNFWPLVLLLIAGRLLVRRRTQGEITAGTVLLLLGFLFLGNNMQWFSIDIRRIWELYWPVIIIIAGISILIGPRRKPK